VTRDHQDQDVSRAGGDPGVAFRRDIGDDERRATRIEPVAPEQHHAIVVGIDGYPGYRDLGGACNDAESFASWLIDPAGGRTPVENVSMHLGRVPQTLAEARPLKRDVDVALHGIVRQVQATGARSRLWLYFAGHGVAAAFGMGAVLMADAQPGLNWNLSIGKYHEWLMRCRDFSEVVMISDCCRNLAVEVPEGMPPLDNCPAPSDRRQQLFLAHGTDLGAPAFEGDDARGRFTVHLLEGLRGAAADPNGDVRSDALATFLESTPLDPTGVTTQVPTTTSAGPPLLLASGRGSRPVFDVTIELRAAAARQVTVRRGDGAIMATAQREAGPWSVPLAGGLYELVDPVAPPVLFKVAHGPCRVEG